MEFFLIIAVEYGSFLVFPFIAILIWKRRFLSTHKIVATGLIALTLLFLYARFVEPQRIVVRHEPAAPGLENFKFALFSDPHLGTYKGSKFLERALHKDDWNKNVDFILIAGDWVYGINERQIETDFKPLADLNVPIYAILGNHDFQPAGELTPEKGQKLTAELQSLGVTLIDNRIETFEKNGEKLQIAGLGELWNDEAQTEILDALNDDLPNIVLMHNPDIAGSLPKKIANLLLAGHTHGGQVRIPFLYKYVIPTELDFGDGQGWYNLNENPLYITSGIGESNLPLRLGVPPEIVIFNESL